MKGIRWIVGLPLGYGVYQFVMWFNFNILFYLIPKLPFIPKLLWQLEGFFVNGVLSIFISVSSTYLFLPRDEFALINNLKIKVIYWALSVWTVAQLIILGVLLHDAFTHYLGGMIFQILFVPVMIYTMWFTYKILVFLDIKYNQPARDYYEQKLNEDQEVNI